MAVKIRLMRVGKKKQPTYRVVVADARSPRDGRFIEVIGKYQPRAEPSVVDIDADLALAWLRKGAQPTDQVGKLLEIAGVWERYRSEAGRTAAAQPKPRAAKPKAAPAPAADAASERAAEAAPEPAAETAPEPAAADAPAADEPAAAEEPAE